MCRSVPQMEATFTLTSTSEGPKAGILTSRISAPGAASGLTTAIIVRSVVVWSLVELPMIATYEFGTKTDANTKHLILAPGARANPLLEASIVGSAVLEPCASLARVRSRSGVGSRATRKLLRRPSAQKPAPSSRSLQTTFAITASKERATDSYGESRIREVQVLRRSSVFGLRCRRQSVRGSGPGALSGRLGAWFSCSQHSRRKLYRRRRSHSDRSRRSGHKSPRLSF